MQTRRTFLRTAAVLSARAARRGGNGRPSGLDPLGKIHIPIGIPNSLDSMKTFVEAEGNFSPGFGSYGIYFWLYDRQENKLIAPTMPEVSCEHGLPAPGYLAPWSRWDAGPVEVTTEVCEMAEGVPSSMGLVVAARVKLVNNADSERKVALIAALRPLGAAGGPVRRLEALPDALLVDGHPALLSTEKPAQAGVSGMDDIGTAAASATLPVRTTAESASGDCSGALLFDITLPSEGEKTLGFVCPVLPGRRASRHKWVDLKQNALVDVAELDDPNGIPQPDLGLTFYRGLKPDRIFQEVAALWQFVSGRVNVQMPNRRWGECLTAVLCHSTMCMNEGAPDVAVVNYNVFNRDGVYLANIMQKAGINELSNAALNYFLAHPFNGRGYPEADNPGQVLWSLSQQWLFARDRAWLARVYPAVQKLAAMVAYYRTAPGPHWVNMNSLEFGDFLPPEKRQELKPGACDGLHPEYTQAFDVAGLRGAALLAEAAGNATEAATWKTLADRLFAAYDEKFGAQLGREYGSYSVLWPCRLYPLGEGKAAEQFRRLGPQSPTGWRYFPLATAHQSLLAGNREAAFTTLRRHLEHPQMTGWYAFDEFEDGPGSASGGWQKVRTTWPRSQDRPGDNRSVAMPHGWAMAEVWLLLRDAIAFEDGETLVLLAGVPPEWFGHRSGMRVSGLQTYFGECSFRYALEGAGAHLVLDSAVAPPGGFRLRFPDVVAEVQVNDQPLSRAPNGDWLLPRDKRSAKILFS